MPREISSLITNKGDALFEKCKRRRSNFSREKYIIFGACFNHQKKILIKI